MSSEPRAANAKSNARPPRERRAFSLLELVAVVAIIGLLAGMASMRFGDDALAVARAEGFTRRLALGLQLARRQAISEGVNAALTLQRTGGVVESWTIVRAPTAGDEVTEATTSLPADTTVTTSDDRWEFDYTGALVTPSSGGTVRVDAPNWYWNVQVYAATGSVTVSRVANP